MKLRLISLLVGLAAAVSAEAATYNLEPDYYGLERINWATQATDTDGHVRVGQYTRDPGVGWDSEALVDLDLTGVSGTVTSVKVTLNVTSANVGWAYGSFTPTVTLFDQNSITLPSPVSSVAYNSFPMSVWNTPLASKAISNYFTGSFVIESSTDLVNKVQGWLDNPSTNQGFMITGDFRHHTYFLNFNDVDVEVITTSTPPPLTTVEEIVGFEDVTLWNSSLSDFVIIEDTNEKFSGGQSFHITAVANAITTNLGSIDFSTNNILNVQDTVVVRVKNNKSKCFPISLFVDENLIGSATVNVQSGFQMLMIPFNNGSNGIAAKNLLIGNNTVNFSFEVPFDAVDSYDFHIDGISIPGAIVK